MNYRIGDMDLEKIDTVQYSLNALKESRKEFWVLVAIDVGNAFNSTTWNPIYEKVDRKGVSRSYKHNSDRTIKIYNKITISTTVVVPQGSVLGSLLWNNNVWWRVVYGTSERIINDSICR